MALVTRFRPFLIATLLLPLCMQAQPPIPPGMPNLIVNVQVLPPYNASYAS